MIEPATTSRPPNTKARLIALEALASPVRQEVISELAEGPGTVKELSSRLSRSRQALHFHIDVLESAGLVEVASIRGEGRAQERVYRVARGAADLRGTNLSARERAAAAKASKAMLRMTERDIARTLAHEKLDAGGEQSTAVAIRAKGRLDAAALKRLHELWREMVGLFREAKGKNQDQPFLAMTIVLTPTRGTRSKSRREPTHKGESS